MTTLERETDTHFYSSIEASVSSASSSTVQVSGSTESSTTEPESSPTPLTPAQKKEQAQEKIALDLKTWQEKFSVAADKGSDDLKERVGEIVASQLESGSRTYGESLVLSLEKTAEEELETLKSQTNRIVESLSEVCTTQDEDNAQSELLNAVRASGVALRERAHDLRQWFNNFDAELLRRASAASDSTLDVLDSIRDLGLQEIGMRWAWMDGVTYKDWAKYHALKKQFAEWRKEVRAVGMEHDDLTNARTTGSDILSNGMAVAENVARELSRIKEVGKWKIEARDSSEDFTDRSESAASVRAEKGIPACSVAVEESVPSGSHTEESSATSTSVEDIEDSEQTEQSPDLDTDSVADDEVTLPLSSTSGDSPDESNDTDDEQTEDSSAVWGGAVAQAMNNEGSADGDNVEESM